MTWKPAGTFSVGFGGTEMTWGDLEALFVAKGAGKSARVIFIGWGVRVWVGTTLFVVTGVVCWCLDSVTASVVGKLAVWGFCFASGVAVSWLEILGKPQAVAVSKTSKDIRRRKSCMTKDKDTKCDLFFRVVAECTKRSLFQ